MIWITSSGKLLKICNVDMGVEWSKNGNIANLSLYTIACIPGVVIEGTGA